MKISARNQLKGTIVDVVKGATTSHIRIDIGGGVIVTSSITNEAVDELKLAKGKAAIAVIKASDVMVGTIDRPPHPDRGPVGGADCAAQRTRTNHQGCRGAQRAGPRKGIARVSGRAAGGDPALYAGA